MHGLIIALIRVNSTAFLLFVGFAVEGINFNIIGYFYASWQLRNFSLLYFGEDAFGESVESRLYFFILGGSNLQKFQFFFICESFAFFVSDLSLWLKISFVTNQKHFHRFVTIGLNFLHPLL